MDYFQGVVIEYLRQDRSTFVNPECLIQLEPGNVPDKGRSWYCDVVAADFSESTLYLCEVSYSTTMSALSKRLKAWAEHWPGIRTALLRDCNMPKEWKVQPWLFVPRDLCAAIRRKMPAAHSHGSDGCAAMPVPRITTLEEVAPWTEQSKARAGPRANVNKQPD